MQLQFTLSLSLQLSRENIQHFQNMKFINFFLMWIIFALLDPDPALQI
jgi:hypothetical protein